MKTGTACPCGSGRSYDECCGPCHAGVAAATAGSTDALPLGTAYALGLENYLLDTWYPGTRPARLDLDADPRVKSMSLEIRRATEHHVEFIARYKVGGRAHRLHETSDFAVVDGRWYYVSGKVGEA